MWVSHIWQSAFFLRVDASLSCPLDQKIPSGDFYNILTEKKQNKNQCTDNLLKSLMVIFEYTIDTVRVTTYFPFQFY